ncbi:DoxX family protein [Actinokineospora bangkokensis]|uniref:DoxX family protein n=1 Tax=Actinokineospora bangkokensis TaxID=1193682 RepID=A0A1Q9LHW7_9PSEU|nr:DoxX family protein [Actinokineospora bangkokensis]OLR91615.1 hypothetical protein BJP25_26015 [Actinokineospora bangkokensis]
MSSDEFYRTSEATTGPGYDRVGYDTGPTTTFAAPDTDHAPARTRPPHEWHFGADLALFVLRVTVGALFVGHGLQKVFGLLGGPGIGGTTDLLTGLGFQRANLLAWVLGGTELGAGALLVLGLFTPAAAAGVLGVMANAIYLRIDVGAFAGGVELEAVYAAAGFALLFAGAGKISLDRNSPWFRRAPAWGFIFLLLAAGLTVVTLVVLR